MVGIASIGNAFGRMFWAWISDAITRRWTFVTMFLLQVGILWILPGISSAAVLTAFAFIILMCYGGGSGTMPAFTADYFGAKNVGPIYGLIMTAWGCASAFGPLLFAHLRQISGTYTSGLHVVAVIMALSVALPILISPPKRAANAADDSQPLQSLDFTSVEP
jgi:OFA family oxalate/formate antiporter-like MFS transporter